jgi:exonuclease III
LNFRLLSWNVAGRARRLKDQVEAILEVGPDIVALQEVISRTAPIFCSAFLNSGYDFVVDSFGLSADLEVLKGPRRYGQLIASRYPLTPLTPAHFNVPWPERVLSAIVHLPGRKIELHNVHIPPGSSNGWTKIEMFEGIYQRLACELHLPRILCGDFNSPQAEYHDKTVVTWGQSIRKDGSVKIVRGYDRWDRGERNVLVGLIEYDLVDVFRSLSGFDVVEKSWFMMRKGVEFSRRFDHVFASRLLRCSKCEYVHSVRQKGLSDHSPMVVDFFRGRDKKMG